MTLANGHDPPDRREPLADPPLHEYEGNMVKIVVRMTRAQYDEFFRYVTEHRTTMSAEGRKAIVERMK